MAIVNALAGIMASDLTTAEAWYEQLLSRPADARPMEGLAEWKLADGGWIHVFQDKDRAGSSSVTFLVSGLDDQLAELKAKGISIERTTTSDYVKTAADLRERGTRIAPERAHLIDEPIGEIEARAVCIEYQVLTVELGLELTDHRIVARVDDVAKLAYWLATTA